MHGCGFPTISNVFSFWDFGFTCRSGGPSLKSSAHYPQPFCEWVVDHHVDHQAARRHLYLLFYKLGFGELYQCGPTRNILAS